MFGTPFMSSSFDDDAPPRVVLNKVGLPNRPEIPLKDFGEALGLMPCLSIAFDAKLFGQAANNGQMLIELQPKAAPSEAVRRLARTVTGRSATSSSDKNTTSLFSLLKTKKQA